MSEWIEYKVADLGRVLTGKTPKTSNREYYDNTVYYTVR